MRKLLISAAIGLSLGLGMGLSSAAIASEGGTPLLKADWSFNGIFGKFDRVAIKRGGQIFFQVCGNCHSMHLMSYRNLVDIGWTEDEAKALAAEYEVQDGPNDEGEMFMRPARLSDRFVAPFPNEKAARFSNGGAYPPDLSVITKARANGPDYIYSLLQGYSEDVPEHVELAEGTHYNAYFPGNQIFMAPPISGADVEFEDGTTVDLEQEARYVVNFLAWAAEPELEARKSMGIKVMLYLILLTGMFYALKRRIWGRLCMDEHTHGPYEERYQKDLDSHKKHG